jgi:hypothetical protein
MKALSTAAMIIALAFAPAHCANAAAIQVFDTGVDSNGALLVTGAVDPHYAISASPAGSQAAAARSLSGTWVSNTPSSQWIVPSVHTFDVGDFFYTTTFSLLSPNATTLSGLEAADNELTVFLNGKSVFTNTSSFGFASLTPFTINSGFLVGTNTLVFEVHNDGGPTGLQVLLSGTTPSAATPEPASLVLVCCGCTVWLGIYAARRHLSVIRFPERRPLLSGKKVLYWSL